MVNLVQKTYKMYEQLEVRVKEKAVMIPANRVIEVSCKANLDQINNRRAMLLQLVKLTYTESIVMLKPRINKYFKIAVVNDNRRDIVLKNNQKLGYLEYINPIVPLDVKEVQKQNKQQQRNSRETPIINRLTKNAN